MVRANPLRRLSILALSTGLALAAAIPARATVSTVFSCPSSGNGGNHDSIQNGFYVQDLNAVNLHTVVLDYTTDQSGLYSLSLTAHRNTAGGQLIGTTLTKTVSLSSGGDTAVTWDFGDVAFPTGTTVYFTHTESGSGGVQFNLQPTVCAGDEETVGLSTTPNGVSVAVTITENVTAPPPPTGCVANAVTLCLDDVPGDKRFSVAVSFATSQSGGESGHGQAIQLGSVGVTQGGLFWFFGPSNPELLVKVLNGCGLNSKFWVFFSAGTNVGFHLTVTDTKTSHTAAYSNPDLKAAEPVQDTSALDCP